MAINLASKYSDKLALYFTQASIMKGMGNNDYSFEGVKTVKIWTPITQALSNYTRTGTSRYGTPAELQDILQELTLSQDKSFSMTVDKGNNSEQMNTKNAMKMLRQEIDEQVIPTYDKYVLSNLCYNAGLSGYSASALAKNTIGGEIAGALAAMDNALVPENGRKIILGATKYNLLRLSDEYIGTHNDKLTQSAIVRGKVGEFMNCDVIKVPDSYLPTVVNFLIVYPKSFTAPWKINDTKVHIDPPGINGSLMEGRFIWDAFVIGAKAAGVYVDGSTSSSKQATPTITISDNSATLASSGATAIKYTLDGSDPRYSPTALTYSSAVTMAAGETIKAVAYKTDVLTSDVASKTNS